MAEDFCQLLWVGRKVLNSALARVACTFPSPCLVVAFLMSMIFDAHCNKKGNYI